MADLNASDRKLLRDTAQLIENGAESLKSTSTITVNVRGKPPVVKWDSVVDRLTYEREKKMAARLRDLAHGISWKSGRG